MHIRTACALSEETFGEAIVAHRSRSIGKKATPPVSPVVASAMMQLAGVRHALFNPLRIKKALG